MPKDYNYYINFTTIVNVFVVLLKLKLKNNIYLFTAECNNNDHQGIIVRR